MSGIGVLPWGCAAVRPVGCSIGTGWLSLIQKKVRFWAKPWGKKDTWPSGHLGESLPSEPDSRFYGFWPVPPGSDSVFCSLWVIEMDGRDAETRLVRRLFQAYIEVAAGLRTQAPSFTSNHKCLCAVKARQCIFESEGCFHIICWIIDKSRVLIKLKASTVSEFLQIGSATFLAWPALLHGSWEKGFLESSLSGLDFGDLLNFRWAFQPVTRVFRREVYPFSQPHHSLPPSPLPPRAPRELH